MAQNRLFWYAIFWAHAVAAFWGGKKQVVASPRHELNLSPIEMLQSGSQPSEVYTVALSELQDLESEPLCHRIAARLLIGNCQLLDGKSEATVLTDSGRQIRDFVDSYAASMAICDLERGRFTIPSVCDKFREPALGQLSLDGQARLHVTSREIDHCLSGLAAETSAWSTWVSYRHKSLRFCEAARADQEKAQNILLYQRLIQVMAKMTHGVEVDIQKHMENLELRVQRTGDVIANLEPELDRLRAKLAMVDSYITENLDITLKKSSESVSNGLVDTANLQRILAVMMQTVLDGTSHVAAAQEKSIDVFVEGRKDLDRWAALVATASASALSLTSQIESSRLGLQELFERQQVLAGGLDQLTSTTLTLSMKQDDQVRSLKEAQNMTNDILGTLDEVAASAMVLEGASQSYLGWSGLFRWTSYIVSPVVTLMLGSYGLAPSALRNLGLAALGEVFGYLLCHSDRIFVPLGFLATTHRCEWVREATQQQVPNYLGSRSNPSGTIPNCTYAGDRLDEILNMESPEMPNVLAIIYPVMVAEGPPTEWRWSFMSTHPHQIPYLASESECPKTVKNVTMDSNGRWKGFCKSGAVIRLDHCKPPKWDRTYRDKGYRPNCSPYEGSSIVARPPDNVDNAALADGMVPANKLRYFAADETNTTLGIGSINESVTRENLLWLFGSFGQIRYLSRPRITCAFVQFALRRDALMALQQLQGIPIYETRMRLFWGKPEVRNQNEFQVSSGPLLVKGNRHRKPQKPRVDISRGGQHRDLDGQSRYPYGQPSQDQVLVGVSAPLGDTNGYNIQRDEQRDPGLQDWQSNNQGNNTVPTPLGVVPLSPINEIHPEPEDGGSNGSFRSPHSEPVAHLCSQWAPTTPQSSHSAQVTLQKPDRKGKGRAVPGVCLQCSSRVSDTSEDWQSRHQPPHDSRCPSPESQKTIVRSNSGGSNLAVRGSRTGEQTSFEQGARSDDGDRN
ncbi:hypothetical protein DHEL01_v206644 [Diaporthe helianthi]|uniref:RRM domain-containing protein n=1 Tax=Diaporthe helianthi TaxID=158607 RepID=A0A2P5HXI2_DIAHE|nr:hypothetical protein DHEL01_v206644 [Diaporthe helianthi]